MALSLRLFLLFLWFLVPLAVLSAEPGTGNSYFSVQVERNQGTGQFPSSSFGFVWTTTTNENDGDRKQRKRHLADTLGVPVRAGDFQRLVAQAKQSRAALGEPGNSDSSTTTTTEKKEQRKAFLESAKPTATTTHTTTTLSQQKQRQLPDNEDGGEDSSSTKRSKKGCKTKPSPSLEGGTPSPGGSTPEQHGRHKHRRRLMMNGESKPTTKSPKASSSCAEATTTPSPAGSTRSPSTLSPHSYPTVSTETETAPPVTSSPTDTCTTQVTQCLAAPVATDFRDVTAVDLSTACNDAWCCFVDCYLSSPPSSTTFPASSTCQACGCDYARAIGGSGNVAQAEFAFVSAEGCASDDAFADFNWCTYMVSHELNGITEYPSSTELTAACQDFVACTSCQVDSTSADGAYDYFNCLMADYIMDMGCLYELEHYNFTTTR